MTLRLVTAPTAEPITLLEAKNHLRVDHSADDGLIEALIGAAREAIEAETSRSLLSTAWEKRFRKLPLIDDALVLPRAPLLTVSAVTYIDTAGATQTLNPATYVVDAPSGPHAGFASLRQAYNASWPSLQDEPNAVRVAFTAGYAVVPAALRAALLLVLGELYANREASLVGVTVNENPAVLRLLAPFRIQAWEA
jgi:uncharacterized phiE125 gp8 family phage protein